MKSINFFEIPAANGIKTVKLLHGDISKVSFPVEIVVASAFSGAYKPSKGTLLGALWENLGISVKEELIPSETDYRNRLGAFLYPVEKPNIKDLLILEMIGANVPIHQTLENLFLFLNALELKGNKFKSVMMPILGAGLQGIPPEEILKDLIHLVSAYLQQSSCVQTVSFVAYQSEHVDLLDNELNSILGRPKHLFTSIDAIKPIRSQTLHTLNIMSYLLPNDLVSQFREILSVDDPEPVKFALLGRKLSELMVKEILPYDPENLNKGINGLYTLNVAPWIINYLHLLRVFGNEFAHFRTTKPPIPSKIIESDFMMVLIALENVFRFFGEYKTIHMKP